MLVGVTLNTIVNELISIDLSSFGKLINFVHDKLLKNTEYLTEKAFNLNELEWKQNKLTWDFTIYFSYKMLIQGLILYLV